MLLFSAMISREIQKELSASAREYPSVTILGPRQSGKTTLAQMTFPEKPYCSLEDPDIRRQAMNDPRGLLSNYPDGAILDEIQKVPELLSYLQGIIDEDQTPGRYILTGSHQPQVHQAISQSLAGRTAVLELLPFSFSELRQYDRPTLSPFEAIITGFYPRLHENQLRPGRFFGSYLSTYIERDIRALINLKDLVRFEGFLRILAGRIGQLVNYTSLSNDVGVSSTTIKDWISVLKASYIIFELPPFFTNIRKRVVKSPKLYFTDVGLAAWLIGLENSEQAERDPLRGLLYENLVIMEVVKKSINQGKRPVLHFYRDARGNEVDLLICEGRSFTAVEIKSAMTFQSEFVSGIQCFQQAIKNNKTPVRGKVWYNGKQKTVYSNIDVDNPFVHDFTW
jgi:predicted AAA+ superfamily ATPase